MSRESRRRLLLRAHAAAKRFCKKAEGQPYFVPATDAFVAGWLLGYRAHGRDVKPLVQSVERFVARPRLYEPLPRGGCQCGQFDELPADSVSYMDNRGTRIHRSDKCWWVIKNGQPE